MSARIPGKYMVIARLALILTAAFDAAHVSAQSLRVSAANSSTDNSVYDVFFNPSGTTLLNNNGSAFSSFHSLVYVPNTASAGGIDLLVADAAGGTIVRYFGPTGTPAVSSTLVWSAASAIPGPRQPDGLSVDAAGNLYAITAVGGPNGPQLWVLPATPINATAATGYLPPVLLDQNFNGNEVDSVVETIIVPAPATAAAASAYASAGINPGDLLLLASDNDFYSNDNGIYDPQEPALVYRYPVAAIQAAIDCAVSGSTGCSTQVKPTILLWELQFPYAAGGWPNGTRPSGMDIWPLDGSLLISTNRGSILQYTLPAAATNTLPPGWTAISTTFASIACGASPCPFYKLRTGLQAGNAYTFVTQSTGESSGNVLEFAVPSGTPTPPGGFGFSAPAATVAVTTGSPAGLTVAPASVVVASSSTCTSATGCNPTGGLANVILPGPAGVGPQGVNGNIIEQTCIITDTRLLPNGTCPGTLTITAQLCPGFAANTIPPTICGASGPLRNQFAALQTIANGVDNVPDIVVQTQESPSTLIPGTTNTPPCAQQVLGWTTRLDSTEGTEPEGSNLIDMTGYCDGGGGATKGNSMWLIGGDLSTAVSSNTSELVRYANQKLEFLAEMVRTAPIATPAKLELDACLIITAILLDTGHHAAAAYSTWECSQLVIKTQKSYGSSAANPNPYGDTIGRLGSLYFTINTRIVGNAPNTIWPLPTAPTPPAH